MDSYRGCNRNFIRRNAVQEVIWVSTETGQVADRELDIVVNFIPDPRLAVLKQQRHLTPSLSTREPG